MVDCYNHCRDKIYCLKFFTFYNITLRVFIRMLAHVIIMILYIAMMCCDQSLRVSFCIFLIQQPASILYMGLYMHSGYMYCIVNVLVKI